MEVKLETESVKGKQQRKRWGRGRGLKLNPPAFRNSSQCKMDNGRVHVGDEHPRREQLVGYVKCMSPTRHL